MKHHSNSWEDREDSHKAAFSAEAGYSPEGTFSIVRAEKGLLLASVQWVQVRDAAEHQEYTEHSPSTK